MPPLQQSRTPWGGGPHKFETPALSRRGTRQSCRFLGGGQIRFWRNAKDSCMQIVSNFSPPRPSWNHYSLISFHFLLCLLCILSVFGLIWTQARTWTWIAAWLQDRMKIWKKLKALKVGGIECQKISIRCA